MRRSLCAALALAGCGPLADGDGGDGRPDVDDLSAADLAASAALGRHLLDLANADRGHFSDECLGCGPLAWSEPLHRVALAHALDMCARAFFAHDNPDGEDPFERMTAGGVGFVVAAENIAFAAVPGVDADAPEKARRALVAGQHRGFMDECVCYRTGPPCTRRQAGHRANLLDPRLTEVGIAVYPCPDDARVGGATGFLTVQDFASPRFPDDRVADYCEGVGPADPPEPPSTAAP